MFVSLKGNFAMVQNNFKISSEFRFVLISTILLLFFPVNLLAASSTDEADPLLMIRNLQTLGVIINSVSIGMGVFFILVGFFKLKKYGESRTMMSQQLSMLPALLSILVGSALLSLPATLELLQSSVWVNANPLAVSGGSYDDWYMALILFVRVIGIISILRGIVGLASVGGQGGQPGKAAKCFMFMLGGVFCLHIQGTTTLLKNIFGYTS